MVKFLGLVYCSGRLLGDVRFDFSVGSEFMKSDSNYIRRKQSRC